MGHSLRTRTRSTISVASTALPKSISLSMQNFLHSPCLPSSISCWYFVSFIAMVVSRQLVRGYGIVALSLAGDRDGGLRADLRCVDLEPVAGLDGRDRVLV